MVGQRGGEFTAVLLNNGDDTFAAPVQYASGDGPRDVALTDLTGTASPTWPWPTTCAGRWRCCPGWGTGPSAGDLHPIPYAGQSMTLVIWTGTARWTHRRHPNGITFLPGKGNGSLGPPVDYCSVRLRSIQIQESTVTGA